MERTIATSDAIKKQYTRNIAEKQTLYGIPAVMEEFSITNECILRSIIYESYRKK
jgi:hypothetical protein